MEIEKLLDDCRSLSAEQTAHLRKNLADKFLMHRNMEAAFKRLRELIGLRKPGLLIMLCGPTNVGKTKLVKTMDKLLIADAIKNGTPIWGSAYCRLPSPVRARFDHGETYRRTLSSLEEPLTELKVEYPDIREGAAPRRTQFRSGRAPTHAALLQALVHRLQAGHSAIFFDEAGELAQSLKVSSLREAVNLFKQLADVGGATVVLVSGPEIGPMLWEAGPLSARTKLVRLDPYNPEVEADLKVFCAVLAVVGKNLGADYIVPGTLCSKNATEIARMVRGTLGIAIDIIIDASYSSLLAGNGPPAWDALRSAVVLRMEEIGTTIDQEQALWEGVKVESERAKYWGAFSAPGFFEDKLVLPIKGHSAKHEGSATSQTETASRGKSEAAKVRIQAPAEIAATTPVPAKRGMHPTRPKRVPLGRFKAERGEEAENA